MIVHLALLLMVFLGENCLAVKIDNYRADLFQLDSYPAVRLYRQSSTTEKVSGHDRIQNVYYYGAGPDQIAVEEEIDISEGEVSRYLIKHHQLREDWLTILDKKMVTYRKRDWDDDQSLEESIQKREKDFLVAPMVIPYLQKHWAKIMAGETLRVRFGVPARKESVGFKLFKIAETEYGGQPSVVIKMRPSSFFIALLVDPLLMTMKSDGGALLRLKGRTLPRKMVSDRWKDTDVDTHFQNLAPAYRGESQVSLIPSDKQK